MSRNNCNNNNNNNPVIIKDDEFYKDEYVVNIIHDLRSHVNVILSAEQIMEHSIDESKEETKYLEMIRRSSYKMLKLINNIIDTDRLGNDYYILNKQNTEIVSLLENTIGEIAKYAAKRNINLIFDTNEEECEVVIDSDAIDRVLMNLLSNAIKFSNDDSNIYINLYVAENEVSFSVKDEGCGISKDEIDKIFNRFYQATKARNSFSGSGIGLNLSYYLVKAHGGNIIIKSELNKGSEFKVILPRSEEKPGKTIENKNLEGLSEKIEIEFSDIQ